MRTAIAALAIGLAGLGAAQAETQITGAGSTFAAPIYAKWGEAAAAATGIKLNYQAIGSGGRHQPDQQPHGRLRRLRHAGGRRIS